MCYTDKPKIQKIRPTGRSKDHRKTCRQSHYQIRFRCRSLTHYRIQCRIQIQYHSQIQSQCRYRFRFLFQSQIHYQNLSRCPIHYRYLNQSPNQTRTPIPSRCRSQNQNQNRSTRGTYRDRACIPLGPHINTRTWKTTRPAAGLLSDLRFWRQTYLPSADDKLTVGHVETHLRDYLN